MRGRSDRGVDLRVHRWEGSPSREGLGATISAIERHARLCRTFPGEPLLDAGPLIGRLADRDAEPHVFKGLFRDETRLRERTVRDHRHMADVSENAPLLIRIVKYPYVEDVTSGRRRQVFEPLEVDRMRLEDRPRPVAEVRALRDQPLLGNPFRSLDLHPEPLSSPPSVDAWLGSVGRA